MGYIFCEYRSQIAIKLGITQLKYVALTDVPDVMTDVNSAILFSIYIGEIYPSEVSNVNVYMLTLNVSLYN